MGLIGSQIHMVPSFRGCLGESVVHYLTAVPEYV